MRLKGSLGEVFWSSLTNDDSSRVVENAVSSNSRPESFLSNVFQKSFACTREATQQEELSFYDRGARDLPKLALKLVYFT
jgi:hypothetical protein